MCHPTMCFSSIIVVFASALGIVLAQNVIQLPPIIIMPNLKIFFAPQPSTSKFPPFIEFFVQRIQSQFSNYVYEDLSRPQTYEKPVYTLSPAEAATATEPLPNHATETSSVSSISTEATSFIETDDSAIDASETINNNYGTLVVYLKNSTRNSDLGSATQVPPLNSTERNTYITEKTNNASISAGNFTNLERIQNFTSPVLVESVLNITIKVPVLVTNTTLPENVP